MGKLINRIPGSRLLISSLAMSTCVLKALPGKLDIKRHSPSILYLPPVNYLIFITTSMNAGQIHTYLMKLKLNRGSYMSALVLLILLNELGKRDKMRGLPSILSIFRNEFNKFNKTRARMLDSIYHMTNTLKSHFWRKNVRILSLCAQRCYGRHNVSRKSINH